jgi:hypothetical protein
MNIDKTMILELPTSRATNSMRRKPTGHGVAVRGRYRS